MVKYLKFFTKGQKMETMNITFRMDKADKQQFERIISEIGLNLSSAFNIFAKAVIKERKIPFELKAEQSPKPNEESLQVLRDIESGKNLERFTLSQLENEREGGKF